MRATEKVFAIVAAFAAVNVSAQVASPNNEQDRMAIERLRQEDIAATLSDDANQLARLWDEEAVRLQSGASAEVGKAKIYADDQRWQTNLHGGRTLSYKPELKDLQIVDAGPSNGARLKFDSETRNTAARKRYTEKSLEC